jgi:hypothetical protein
MGIYGTSSIPLGPIGSFSDGCHILSGYKNKKHVEEQTHDYTTSEDVL